MPSYYSLGWCYFQGRNYVLALEYFRTIEDKYPKEPQAKDASYKVIECLYNLKNYAALKDKLKSYIAGNAAADKSKAAYLYFYLAESEYYLGNFAEAVNRYLKAADSTGDAKIKDIATLGVGWAYLKSRQYPGAEKIFSQLKTDNLEKRSQDALLLGKAILNYETNKFSEAKNIYAQLIKEAMDANIVVQAYLGEADSVYNLGEYKEAIGIYKEALAKVNSDTPADITDNLHYGLAWAYLKEGEFKTAIEEFQKIVKQSDDKVIKVAALCQIGDTYQESGDYALALQSYDTILKDYPDSLYSDYVQYQVGLTMLKNSNYEGAIAAFQSLKRNFPESRLLDDATYALGLAYFQREDYKSSREIFAKFEQDFKDSNLQAQALYLLGTSLYNLGEFNPAIEAFKNIIRLYTHDTELVQKAEYEIADCFYQLGNEKEAVARFKVLRSKYPDSNLTAEIMWWLGEYYYRNNDLDLARRYFSSLIQDFPKSDLASSCYYALASIYAQEGNNQEALENFQKVITLAKSDLSGQAAVAMADIHIKDNKLDLALSICNKVMADFPNLASLIYPKIADIHSKLGNYAEAIDFYNRSLDIVPVKDMADIQFKIAENMQAQGKLKDAIEQYLKVPYLYAQDSNLAVKAFLRVASLYENQDNFKEALNIYKKVSSTNTQEAKYARERMNWIRANIRIKD